MEITPAPSEDEAAAILIVLREFELLPTSVPISSQWKARSREWSHSLDFARDDKWRSRNY